MRGCGAFRSRFANLALELTRAGRQRVIACLNEERVKTAAMINRSQRVGSHPQLDRATKRI